MNVIENLFGSGQELTALQMGVRAFLMLFIALFLVRISGMRTFGKNSAFDVIISIMLGAVLARGVVGASPFFSVVMAGLVMVLLHRFLGAITLRNEWLEKAIKGESRLLYKDGKIHWDKMRRSAVSKEDLLESARLEANVNSLDEIEEAHIESNGRISIIKKKEKNSNAENFSSSTSGRSF
jgi:uncharacterized membrane protein YcaP (DUF421 family)